MTELWLVSKQLYFRAKPSLQSDMTDPITEVCNGGGSKGVGVINCAWVDQRKLYKTVFSHPHVLNFGEKLAGECLHVCMCCGGRACVFVCAHVGGGCVYLCVPCMCTHQHVDRICICKNSICKGYLRWLENNAAVGKMQDKIQPER